jgi:hypothetical protein
MIRFLPVSIQAKFWWYWANNLYGKTSHFRIEAIKQLRKATS